MLPFTQPLIGDVAEGLPRAYVMCLQDRAIWPDLQRFMAARAGCHPVLGVDTDHSVWLTAPDELVTALDQVARRSVATAQMNEK